MNKELTSEALDENKIIINDIIKMYVIGYNIIEIARLYHITYYKVRKILLDNNVRVRNKNEKV